MSWQYNAYVLPLLLSAIVTGGLAIYTWPRRRSPGATPFIATMAMVTGWSLASALQTAAVDLSAKILWENVQYASYAALPVGMLSLALEYTRRGEWLTRRRLALLCIVPAITLGLSWTNDLHGLMRSEVHLDVTDSFPIVAKTYGPWFWVHLTYSYLLVSATVLLLLEALLRAPPRYRGQPLALSIGLVLPLLWNVFYGLRISPLQRVDVTPVTFSVMGLFLAWGLFRCRLFDIVPVAHDKVINGMRDGVIVVDIKGQVVEINHAGEGMLGCSARQAVGVSAAELLGEHSESAAETHLPAFDGVMPSELNVSRGAHTRSIEVQVSPLTTRGGDPAGHIIGLRDVTERKQAEAQLLHKQRSLAILEERERLARELHDSVGQVLGYLNTQGQAVRELLDRGETIAATTLLNRLVTVAQQAQAEVREYILEVKGGIPPERGFVTVLEHYLRRFAEVHDIQTELKSPDALALHAAVEVQLLRIVQEALTNVRKHASARHVKVIISATGERARIAVEDDGAGFDPNQRTSSGGRTFGLQIMRERAESVAGSLEVSSTRGEGTQVCVAVPLRKE